MIYIIDIILGVLFFYLINWIGKKSVTLGYELPSAFVEDDEAPAFNFVLKVFSPVVYIIIIATILYSFHLDSFVENIWMIVLFYFLYRFVFIIATERYLLINWKAWIAQFIISVSFSYFIYDRLIKYKINFLPDFKTIGNELWIIIFLYLYTVMNNIQTSEEAKRKRSQKYIKKNLSTFKDKYGEIIKENSKNYNVEKLVYSIMLYENFARSKAHRIFEDIFGAKTRGIMQVKSDKRISDLESVEIAIKKINKDYDDSLKKLEESEYPYYEDREIYPTIAKYNRDEDYISEVQSFYDAIKEENLLA